jgi:hypothetical protein
MRDAGESTKPSLAVSANAQSIMMELESLPPASRILYPEFHASLLDRW